ncbi:hypothetical protein GVAMD_1092 [Gardnerella vaginalis AMD]|nr:hypothetical protein GVAMD_1092 [Gardnerella vaginalis AMD]
MPICVRVRLFVFLLAFARRLFSLCIFRLRSVFCVLRLVQISSDFAKLKNFQICEVGFA